MKNGMRIGSGLARAKRIGISTLATITLVLLMVAVPEPGRAEPVQQGTVAVGEFFAARAWQMAVVTLPEVVIVGRDGP